MLANWLLLAAAPAFSSSPYEVDWITDGLLLFSLSATALAGELAADTLQPPRRCELVAAGTHCNPAKLNRLDRTVVGNRSKNWEAASDWGVNATFFIGAAGSGFLALTDPTSEPWVDWARDGMVIAIAATSANIATITWKHAYGRSRPLQYSADTYNPVVFDRERSFPSGHATSAAAVTTALAATIAYRRPWSALAWGAAAASVAVTGFVATARIQAGRHFYTDVAAGALIGATAGVLVPRAYRRDDIVVVPSGDGLSLAVRF